MDQWRWGFDVTISGQRIRRYEWERKQEAIDAVAALYGKARAIRYGLAIARPNVTLQNLKEKCDKDNTINPRNLQLFAQFVNLIGEKTELTKLNKTDWRVFVDSLRTRKLKPGTVNRYLAAVSGVLSSASERFPDLGEWTAPKAPWLDYPLGRNRILSKEEIHKLLAACLVERQYYEQAQMIENRREVFDVIRLMLLTGAREGEILNLKQSQINWDWKTVKIESKKGGGSLRIVPLSGSAWEILKARSDRQRFFNLSRDRLYSTLKRLAEISGVRYGDKTDNGWVFYDLRHVAGTVMENAGIPYSAVAAILGHKRRDQTATYAHAQLDTLKRAVEVLEQHCREIDGFFPEIAANRLGMLTESKQA